MVSSFYINQHRQSGHFHSILNEAEFYLQWWYTSEVWGTKPLYIFGKIKRMQQISSLGCTFKNKKSKFHGAALSPTH